MHIYDYIYIAIPFVFIRVQYYLYLLMNILSFVFEQSFCCSRNHFPLVPQSNGQLYVQPGVYLAVLLGGVEDVAPLLDVVLEGGAPGLLPAAVVADQQLASGPQPRLDNEES